MYYLKVLEIRISRLQSRCRAACVSVGGSREDSVFMPSPFSRGCLRSLGGGCFSPPSKPAMASISHLRNEVPNSLPLLRTLVITRGPPRSSKMISHSFYFNFLIYLLTRPTGPLFLLYLIFREMGRAGERQGVKYQLVASHMPPTRALACNSGICMCPDRELNWRPFDLQGGTQPTEPYQPGHDLPFLMSPNRQP